MAARDEAALAAFYDLTIDRVFATVVRVLNNAADAEEVACDVFQQAWDRASLYAPDRGAPISWLLNLAWSRAVDRVRRERRRREQPSHPGAHHAAYAEDGDDPRQRLFDALDAGTAAAHAMSRLTDVQQRLLAMAFLEDLTHAEISERTRLPLGTVKSHLRRALGTLRMAMEPTGGCHG